MPYSTGLVSFGGEPAVVSDSLVHAVKQRILQVEQAGGELFDGLHHGDPLLFKMVHLMGTKLSLICVSLAASGCESCSKC
jgi:hypothetical protein